MPTRKRKLWATRFGFPRAPLHRHQSQDAVYRWINHQASTFAGASTLQHVTVLVDERDGRGWQTYEQIDLAELAAAGSQVGDQQ